MNIRFRRLKKQKEVIENVKRELSFRDNRASENLREKRVNPFTFTAKSRRTKEERQIRM